MKNKMPIAEIKALFLPPSPHYVSPDGLEIRIGKHAASKPHHRHKKNPVWLPGTGSIPSAYRRRHHGKKMA